MKDVYIGVDSSNVFRRFDIPVDYDQNCFSIVTDKRSLDLRNENEAVTVKWFYAIKFLIKQAILSAFGEFHLFIRELKPIMRICAAGIDRVLIIGYIACREALQVLRWQHSTIERRSRAHSTIHHLYRIGIEMHVMAHFIERYMQRVLGIWTIHNTIFQEQHLPLHTQSADILVKSHRMRLGMHAGDAGNKEYYEG